MSAGVERDVEGRTVLRSLWGHHWWSVDIILDAARGLSEEEFRRDLSISYGSLHGALVHLVAAEMVWLARVERGESMTSVPGVGELADRAAIEREWRRCKEGWLAVLEGDDLRRTIQYRNTKGTQFEDPLWRVLAHLVDHSAAYRGILVVALRLLGRTPPETGLMFYTRQKGKEEG